MYHKRMIDKDLLDNETFQNMQKSYNINADGREDTNFNPRNFADSMLQNIYNTEKFYDYLISVAPSADKTILEKIIANTNEIKNSLTPLYYSLYNKNFEPKEIDINFVSNYAKGITLAIYEETEAMNEYVNFNKLANNPSVERTVEQAIKYKSINLNYLHLLK